MIVLAGALFAFAIQPCFATLAQPASGCCGDHKGRHKPVPAQICAMQATTFAAPEHTGPIVPVAMVSVFAPEPAVVFSFFSNEVTARRLVDSCRLYLRNCLLLI